MPPSTDRPVYLFVLPWSLRIIGGVNQVVANLARQMRDTGIYEPLILTSDWDSPNPTFEEIQGIRTVRWQLRPYRRGMNIKEKIAFSLWEMRFQKKFIRFCAEQNVRVINPHYPGEIAFTLERAIRKKAHDLPLLLSFHGTEVTNLKGLSESQKSEWRYLIERAHTAVVCSKQLGLRMQDALGADLTCQVIYNGVDTEKFVKFRESGESLSSNVILHVGKFDHNKGQDVLIHAFSLVASDFPDASLNLVGGKGLQLSSLRNLASELGLADRINFFVDIPSDEMPQYFSSANIFAFPSRQEGFPLVLLEAGAVGLPVVATRVGGIPELIDDLTTGVLVDPDEPVALANVLRKLMSHRDFAEQLGANLRRRVSENFSWVNALQQYEALAEEACHRAPSLAGLSSTLPVLE